jgi:hypothetical protein
MSNITEKIKTHQLVYPQLYSYILIDQKNFEGSQKIGYTGLKSVDKRILQQVNGTIKLKHEKLWSGPAYFEHGKDFLDTTFHEFLEKKGIERRLDLGKEWFYFNGEPFKSKDLFDLFRSEGFAALQNANGKLEYTLRFEQDEAVKKALDYFQNNDKGEFLWNAKPRFGKTLASYDLAKRLKASKVLIVTNRPAIANSWFDDYETFIEDYAFISETSSLENRNAITRARYNENIKTTPQPQITFLSLQDLKGSKYFGGNFDKLRWVADLDWDLLIVDEAHEAVETKKTKDAFDYVKRKHTLHLSGTPFKALATQKFSKDAIYNWTYIDEQKIKQVEIEEGESGPHADMPDLKLFTYRISQMITNQVNEGIEIDNETVDYAFDLNEFFKAKDKKFLREKEVKDFLTNLTTNKKYPFSTPELRDELKHTFWFVGNRVESVKALEKLLKADDVFKDYEVIVAAGNGQTFEEEADDIKGNENSFEKVKTAIRDYDKTITLSCGQLTTGVTVKEWTAVLMLTDIKSPSLYMQAAFRAQNAYKEMREDGLYMKKSAYLFDFAPTRVLEIYDKFANGLNPKAVKGEITEKDRKNNIHELLNFFPVISEDVNGEMVELDAEKVLTFPNALAATEIVNARFMTNLLFNDTIKGVFNFPKEVEDILNKLPEEKNKRVQITKETLDLDDARQVADNKTTKINENTEIILGEKIFRANTERVVDNLLADSTTQISSDEIVKNVTIVAEPLIAKYKEVYKANQAETDEIKKQIQERVKVVAEEYVNSDIKDKAALVQKIIETIEVDFVKNKVEQKEEAVVEKVQKTKEDEIRDRLRSFTRTIPMFIMANVSKEEITIDNFDLEIDAKDFEDLTSITKEEFHKLRDGFDYEENGVRKTFQGVFNKYRFNASIAEFRLKKEQLANYFTAQEDIFELIPNQKTNQIFTPKKVVQMMIDNLEEHDPSLFTRTDSTFIDLFMKSGMYITEIVKKLYHYTRAQYNSDEDCLKHILENQVYGLAPTPVLQGVTQSYIFGFDTEHSISRKHFIQHDITPEVQLGKAKEKLQELFNLNKNMKFDAVVGNPPYQESISNSAENSSLSKQIFPLFIESCIKLQSNYLSLITPSRWFTGDAQDKSFLKLRQFIKSNNKISKIVNYPNSKDVFSNVVIKGGVNYFIFDEKHAGKVNFINCNGTDCVSEIRNLFEEDIDVIISNGLDYPIIKKVKNKNFLSLTLITTGRNAFDIIGKVSSLNEISKDKPFNGCAKIRCKDNEFRYIEPTLITKNRDIFEKHKIFISKSAGDPNIDLKIIGEPYLGHPFEACTDSLIPIGNFDKLLEAENLQKYIKTKLLRYLVSILKTSQNVTQIVYKFVPIQDFSEKSDIDWTKSISEIDQQLYAKYNLSEEEINHIEKMIKPMV